MEEIEISVIFGCYFIKKVINRYLNKYAFKYLNRYLSNDNIVIMKSVNIQALKQNFAHYIDYLNKGRSIILCKRNVPFAEIRLLKKKHSEKRKFGQHQGWFSFDNAKFNSVGEQLADQFEAPEILSKP